MPLVFSYAQILSNHLFEKELLTPFVISYLLLASVRAVTSFPCDIIGRVWNLIVSVPDPCFLFNIYFDIVLATHLIL